MKRFLKLMAISLVSILCMTFVVSILSGSADASTTKTGPIPNGIYIYNHNESSASDKTAVFDFIMEGSVLEEDLIDFSGYEIKGSKAYKWVSGSTIYKANIVEKDGKIYFKGYKWVDMANVISCSSDKQGTEWIYEVEFNETEKRIITKLVSYD